MQSATLQPEPQRGLARDLSAASEREAISACAETLQWRWAVGLYAEGERRGEDHGGKNTGSLRVSTRRLAILKGLGLTLPAASAAVSAAGRARSWKVRYVP